MIQIVTMLVTGILWFLQGYVFGFQFPFVEGIPVLIVLGQVTQGMSAFGSAAFIASSFFLLMDKFISTKKTGEKYEVDYFYTVMTGVGIVLLICTTL